MDRMTDRCKNITFLQLRLQVVNILVCPCMFYIKCGNAMNICSAVIMFVHSDNVFVATVTVTLLAVIETKDGI